MRNKQLEFEVRISPYMFQVVNHYLADDIDCVEMHCYAILMFAICTQKTTVYKSDVVHQAKIDEPCQCTILYFRSIQYLLKEK